MRPVPTKDLFVCRFWCCWPIPSSIFLLSLLTFSVASLQQPTIAAAPSTTIHPPTAIPLKHHHSLFDHRFAIPLSASLLLLLLLVIIMGCFLGLRFRHKRLAKKVDAASNGSNDLDPKKEKDSDHGTHGCVRKYNWSEIEKLSMNFSQIVGSGGFSTVYLGHLPGSNLGAIKIHCPSDYLNRVFKQELDILLQLQHDNIVKLLGYCDVQGLCLVLLEIKLLVARLFSKFLCAKISLLYFQMKVLWYLSMFPMEPCKINSMVGKEKLRNHQVVQ